MPAIILPIITPLLGLVGVSASATILGTSLTIGALVSNVIAGAVIFGAEALIGAGQRRRPALPIPQSSVAREEEAQDIPPCIWGYGRRRIGGKLLLREWKSGGRVFYSRVVSCRAVGGIDAHIIDNETLTVSAGATIEPYEGIGGYYSSGVDWEDSDIVWPNAGMKHGNYIAYSWDKLQGPVPYVSGVGPFGFLEFRNASADGHVSKLLTHYLPEIWTAEFHRCKGLACVHTKWGTVGLKTHMEHFPNYFPRHSTVVRQSRVYDPRDEAQSFFQLVTGEYSTENPTWEYSENPALQIADLFTFPYGFNKSYDDILWESFATAANDCDRLVATRDGGTRPFSRAHVAASSTDELRDILGDLLAACDGQIFEDADGRIGLWIAKWEEPTVTLTERHISSLKVQRGNSVYADVNELVVRYTEPRLGYAFNTAVLVQDTESIARVGLRSQPLDLEAVQDPEQAYALATRALRRKNTPLKVSATGPLRMMIADGERVVRLDLPRWGVTGVFRVMSLKRVGAAIQGEFHLVTEDMFADVIPPSDALNAELPGVTLLDTSLPPTPDAPLVSEDRDDPDGARILAVARFGGEPAPETDTLSFAKFRSRPVDPTTHAPIGSGEWTIWPGSTALSLYSAMSEVLVAAGAAGQTFEVVCWMVAPRGVAGDMSASSFLSLVGTITADSTIVTADSTTVTADNG